MDTAARLALAALLLTAAASKLVARSEFLDLLGPYGVPERARRPLWAALTLAEGGLGVLLVAGVLVRPAALAAACLGLVFVVVLGRLRLQGVRRLRCGCFGGSERSTAFLLVRAALFTALAALAAFAGKIDVAPSRDTAVVIALGVLALAVLALTALVLALYRQVGVLSLRLGPRSALELAEEGPAVGSDAPALEGLVRQGSELVAFVSPSCRICRELAPALRALERDGVPVRVVDEASESEVFDRWNVPGSPFAVHVLDGAVGAKGLVNTLEELDGLVALGQARGRRAAA